MIRAHLNLQKFSFSVLGNINGVNEAKAYIWGLHNHLLTPGAISLIDNVVKFSTLLLLDLSAVLVARTWT